MFTFEHLQGLPFAVPGDTVEIVVSNGTIGFTHYGINEAERISQDHKGQHHPWSFRLEGRDIKSVRVKAIPKPGGLFGRLLGAGFTSQRASESAYLELEAQIGEARIATVLKGDQQSSLQLKERLLDARSIVVPSRRKLIQL